MVNTGQQGVSKLAPALLIAQRNIGNALKDSTNPFFKSSYATLNSVIDTCKLHLNNAGIVVLQPVNSDGVNEYVETFLMHESGEFISSRMKLLTPKNMQDYGSAISYARRYSLQSLVFMGADDDDGEVTMERKTSITKPVPTLTLERKGTFKHTGIVSKEPYSTAPLITKADTKTEADEF